MMSAFQNMVHGDNSRRPVLVVAFDSLLSPTAGAADGVSPH